MNNTVQTDIAIIGGGIAGLWLLNRLRQMGYSVILLESDTLGGGQTCKSQGIIHGGLKYALQGMLTPSARAIANMPTVWKECLKGNGEINLSNVPVLSEKQYLWSTGSISSKIAGFFAGLTLKSDMSSLTKEQFPDIFQHTEFHGQVYSLDEIVIDVHTLLRELMKPHQDVIFKIDPIRENQLEMDDKERLLSLNIQAGPLPPLQVKAQKYIFTAGSSNELLLKKLKSKTVGMQRRPLHMVVVKHDIPNPVFAHCLGLSSTPRITITTHRAHDGKYIWYIGGQIAEEGVKRSSEEQIQIAKKELQELFYWLDFSSAQFASFFVDRVENLQPDGSRPDSCFMKEIQNMIVAWPTKLSLAPKLADEITQCIKHSAIKPCTADMRELRYWPIPVISTPIWDQLL